MSLIRFLSWILTFSFVVTCHATETMTLFITTKDASVRQTPTKEESNILDKVQPCTAFWALESVQEWQKVQLPDDREGFIHSSIGHIQHMQEPNSKRMQEPNSNSVSLFSLLTHLLAVLFGSAICWLILRHIGSLEKKLVGMEAIQEGKEQASKEISLQIQPFARIEDGWIWKRAVIGYKQQLCIKGFPVGNEMTHIRYSASKVDIGKVKEMLSEVENLIKNIMKQAAGLNGLGVIESKTVDLVGVTVSQLQGH